jgi:hypothetical protein
LGGEIEIRRLPLTPEFVRGLAKQAAVHRQ